MQNCPTNSQNNFKGSEDNLPCISDYNRAWKDIRLSVLTRLERMVHTLRYQESFVNIVFCGRVRESCDGDVQIFRPIFTGGRTERDDRSPP